MKQLLLATLFGLWAVGAAAHSPLKATVPENGAILTMAPNVLTLKFKGKIRLTRVHATVQNEATVNLDLSGSKGFLSIYSIPIDQMGAGTYLIEWRGLGSDGHALSGTFNFTVE